MPQISFSPSFSGRYNLTRRQLFALMGGFVASSLLGCTRRGSASVLTPEETEGPYYLNLDQVRQDIRENKEGVPLKLKLRVLDVPSGRPLEGAAVDIWHCDAAGFYSGFTNRNPDADLDLSAKGNLVPPDPTTFLRGVQLTNSQGEVEFTTIYPGWYAHRDVHIHLKVHVGGADSSNRYEGGHVCHIGQLFFPEDISDLVAKQHPYSLHQKARTRYLDDHVYQTQDGDQMIVALEPLKDGPVPGYTASMTMGVDPAATPAPRPSIRPGNWHPSFFSRLLRELGF
jgi:protocatechuate 3,4-dioxygenase beta subunit